MKDTRLKKIIELLKSLKGKKPDLADPDYSGYQQTEAEYQQQQTEWLKSVRKRKKAKKKR